MFFNAGYCDGLELVSKHDDWVLSSGDYSGEDNKAEN